MSTTPFNSSITPQVLASYQQATEELTRTLARSGDVLNEAIRHMQQTADQAPADDDLDDLLRHYVRKTNINSGTPAPALCGVIKTWRKGAAGGALECVPGIICPDCNSVYERFRP
ncbi:hypothetical protein [Tsukamurella spumae]|uniref:Uncharacterized protein n=1 Tax=Tsukamurella spumae TaxID=44753 RepID=A0A846X2W3_9ACTN|nr:hypothetical protein [Tsukamurella spumae]NKY19957.1 hypothetical protein [Tsukamurella spumae]